MIAKAAIAMPTVATWLSAPATWIMESDEMRDFSDELVFIYTPYKADAAPYLRIVSISSAATESS